MVITGASTKPTGLLPRTRKRSPIPFYSSTLSWTPLILLHLSFVLIILIHSLLIRMSNNEHVAIVQLCHSFWLVSVLDCLHTWSSGYQTQSPGCFPFLLWPEPCDWPSRLKCRSRRRRVKRTSAELLGRLWTSTPTCFPSCRTVHNCSEEEMQWQERCHDIRPLQCLRLETVPATGSSC